MYPFLYGMILYLPLRYQVYSDILSGYLLTPNNVLSCPADHYRANKLKTTAHYHSYMTNYWSTWTNLGDIQMKRPDKMKSPSQYNYLLEGYLDSGSTNTYSCNTFPIKTNQPLSPRIDFRHNNATNALMFDMHVREYKYQQLAGTDLKTCYYK